MQTFLPLEGFRASAVVLDRQRLGKQRVETMQLLNALLDGGGWSNHPAARMWRGYEGALLVYGLEICASWTSRGYKDTCYDKLVAIGQAHDLRDPTPPPWVGDPGFHASHRSNLLRKDPAWYRQFGWDEPDDLPYVWPEP